MVAGDIDTPPPGAPIETRASPEMITSLRVGTDRQSPDFGVVKFAAGRDASISEDFLAGAKAIAQFLGEPWTVRRVRYARETAALPVRMKRGIGLYALKSELRTALTAQDSLPIAKGR